MARVTTGPVTRARRKKWLKYAKGYWGAKSKLYRTAKLAVMHSWQYAYRERKRKKRVMKALWNIRINAAVRPHGLNYSKFMHGLKLSGIFLSRKTLQEIAIEHPEDFEKIVKEVKEKLKEEGMLKEA